MRSSLSSSKSPAAGRVTLVVSHVSDSQADGVRRYLINLAELGLTRPIYWLTVESEETASSSGFEVEVLQKTGAAKVRLFDALSIIGGITAVDIVTIVVGHSKQKDIVSLTATVPMVRRAFEKWLREAPISDIRVFAGTYGEPLPDKVYFSASATTRVVVLPLDPSHDYSVFRPLIGEQPTGLIGHVAVEIVSLLGCWSIQNDVPVDEFRVSGDGPSGSGIHLVMSAMRVLAVPAPPVNEALGSNTQLPVPAGFTAVPRPERLVGSLVEKIYPEDLVFQSQERPEGPTEFVRVDRFFYRFLRQFFAAVWSLLRVIRNGIQHEMDALAIAAMEDAVGGAASSVGLVSSRLKRVATETVDFNLLIDQMIEKAETDLIQNYRFGIPAEDWRSMCHKILALADGEGEPTTRLLIDDTVICSTDVLVPPCEPASSGTEVVRGLIELTEDAPASSIVAKISQKFLGQIKGATTAIADAKKLLNDLPSVIRSRPEIKGDEIIRIAAVFGAALIAVSLGAFSPLRPAFAFEWLPGSVRDAIWALPAALGTLLSIWVLLHLATKDDRTRRIVDVVSSLAIPIVILTLLVQFKDVRRWAIQNGGGANYRYAVALFVVFLVLAILAIRQALKSPEAKHKALGRAGVALCSGYLVIAAVIGLAQNEKPLIDGLPDVRNAVFSVLFPSALISFGISVSRIAISRVREIYKALLVSRLIEWSIDELRRGRDAEIRLEVLRVQWAALGAVLTRMIRFPLGRGLASTLEHDDVATGGTDPLKLDFARLDLTSRGRSGLEARLRQSVVRQGWLNQQVSSVLRTYSKSAGFDRGLTEDEYIKIDPFACTSTPTAEEARDGQARGDRWLLVQELFNGAFEDLLRSPADQIRFDELFVSVLADPKSIRVVGAHQAADSAVPFLGQSVSDKPLTVPLGFLNLLVTGGDSRLNMKRLVWWPVSFVGMNAELRPADAEFRESDLVKPWDDYGTRFAMSLQVNWSDPFAYENLTGTKTMLPEPQTELVNKRRV